MSCLSFLNRIVQRIFIPSGTRSIQHSVDELRAINGGFQSAIDAAKETLNTHQTAEQIDKLTASLREALNRAIERKREQSMLKPELKKQFETEEGRIAHLAKFSSTLGGDSAAFFMDNSETRPKPLVIPHATGHPAFEVNDDGTLSPYRPGEPTGLLHESEYYGVADPAKSIFGA